MAAELDVVRGSLSPLRKRVLEELREPASATTVAARLGETRQRVNYHLRELEKAGLVEVVELRQRRGRQERIVRATARTVVVAPEVVGAPSPGEQDRFAADTLLAVTARTFGDVAEMREQAAQEGKRLVTFTIETDVGFAEPADISRFATDLAARVADLVASYDSPESTRRYRLIIGGHPTPVSDQEREDRP
ncbi:helix-turn-helix domain-containing protein [Nonomuraea sp. NPDC003709]|uniref:helix-turn-helix domain-containing protein n=1 Tax=Nonomuraea sp. NPDC003709 TaxID=3154450 RepID=UPI0033AD9DFE